MGVVFRNEIVVSDSYQGRAGIAPFDVPFNEAIAKFSVYIFDNDALFQVAEQQDWNYEPPNSENEGRFYKGFQTFVPETPIYAVRFRCAISGATSRITLRAYW